MRPSHEKPVKWWQCFCDAARGFKTAWGSERNLRVHVFLLVFAVVLGFFLTLSGGEWLALILCAAVVLVAELLNTALEYLCDAVRPEADPGIGKAKDVAAGAALIAALAAVVVGAILFLPKLWDLFTK